MTETLVAVSPPPKDPSDPPSAEELAAAKELVRQARAQGVALTGPGGLLKALTKTVIETALDEELAEHLGYDKHEPVGRNRGNSRNGKRAKTVLTDSGEVDIEVPRDRDGSFEPVIVAKRQRRLSGIDEIVLSLYARGLTTGDIAAHFADIYGAQVSKDTISRITDRVVEEMQAWTSRPLELIYAAVFIDAINVKVRDGQVANRPVYAAIGVDLEGHKDILGMWFGDGGGESAKFWLAVLTELRNRGVVDVFFLVCDGLKGLPDSVNAVWPRTIVQTCLIHLIRNTFRFASRKYWDELSKDLKPIYQAINADAAAAALEDLHTKWGGRYPAIIRLWRNAWAGSSGALPRRSPLRTGRASCPRIRLKQARWRRRGLLSGRCAV
jgi:putative transposase